MTLTWHQPSAGSFSNKPDARETGTNRVAESEDSRKRTASNATSSKTGGKSHSPKRPLSNADRRNRMSTSPSPRQNSGKIERKVGRRNTDFGESLRQFSRFDSSRAALTEIVQVCFLRDGERVGKQCTLEQEWHPPLHQHESRIGPFRRPREPWSSG